MTQVKWRDSKRYEVRTIVRRKYAETEEKIARDLGYDVEVRFCGDRACLGDEPVSRASL